METTEDYDKRSLNALIRKSILDNWDRMALTDMGGMNYQYKGCGPLDREASHNIRGGRCR